MNRIKILLFTFFAIGSACAQSGYKTDAALAKLGSRSLKFPKFPEASFPKKSILVSEIALVQFLRDSVHLGYVLKGADDQVAEIVTPSPVTIFLQEHINKMYREEFKKEGSKILLVIKNLRIGERSGLSQYSYLRFIADAYIEIGKDQYQKLATVDTLYFSQSSIDVTAWHGQEIEDAIKLLINDATKKRNADNTMAELVNSESIIKTSSPITDLPILQDAIFKEGAYANFEEFLQNSPTITDYKPVVVEKKKSKSVKGFINSNSDTITVWGFSTNGEIYKFAGEQLVPIEKQGNYFLVSDYVIKTNRLNGQAFSSALMSGIIGGIGVALLTNYKTPIIPITNYSHIKKAKEQPLGSIIDMETGELAF